MPLVGEKAGRNEMKEILLVDDALGTGSAQSNDSGTAGRATVDG